MFNSVIVGRERELDRVAKVAREQLSNCGANCLVQPEIVVTQCWRFNITEDELEKCRNELSESDSLAGSWRGNSTRPAEGFGRGASHHNDSAVYYYYRLQRAVFLQYKRTYLGPIIKMLSVCRRGHVQG